MKKVLFLLFVAVSLLGCKEHDKKSPHPKSTVALPVGLDTVFSLSMIANLTAAAYEPALELPLDQNKAADSAVARVIRFTSSKMDSTLSFAVDNTNGQNLSLANWKRVWGPAVSVNISDMLLGAYVSSASVTIFKDTTQNNYVVAIQATNPNSNRDWSKYDFNVSTVQPWASVTGTGTGNISEGTYLGLQSLFGLSVNNVTIVQFLNNIISNTQNNNIIITGHSLGGALAPVLALYMQHELDSITTKTANASSNTVYCLSTAGATPGDTTFANYYDTVDNSLLAGNTVRIWNYFDMVPRAWDTTLLGQVQNYGLNGGGLYDSTGGSYFYDSTYSCKNDTSILFNFSPMTTTPNLDAIISYAIKQADSPAVPYRYLVNNGTYFMGADTAGTKSFYLFVDTSGYYGTGPNAPIVFIKNWLTTYFGITLTVQDYEILAEEGAQHVASYAQHFHMKQVHEYMKMLVDRDGRSTANRPCNGILTNTPQKGLMLPEKPNPYSLMLGIVYQTAWQW
jgi:hypothetical protein